MKKPQYKFLVAKSILLAVIFLLRFQALKYCGTAALILAELSGNVAARFLAENKNGNFGDKNQFRSPRVRGFIALFLGLFLLSISWDRLKCFPLSSVNVYEFGFAIFPGGNCLRIWPMLLPFFSGFLGSYEQVSINWGNLGELGHKRVRLLSLFFTTILLFFPAMIDMFIFEGDIDAVLIMNYGWPLANIVVFGVLLSENYSNEKFAASKDFQSEYLLTFLCTLVLELVYFPELSLWGLLICGFFLWIAIRELDPVTSYYPELGVDSSDSFTASVMKPIRHILSERKSRKIALFLLINTAYMFVEFIAGFLSNSLGLISDACHMLFDCAALAIGLYASYISRLPANNQFNYGRGRFEVLSGYVNAVLLVLVGVLIVLESLERILEPQEISTSSLLAVSVGGLIVNIVGLIFFHEEHHHAHGGSGSCSHSHSNSHLHAKSDSHSHNHRQHHVHGSAGSCSHVHFDSHSNGQSNHPHDYHQHNPNSGAGSCSHSQSAQHHMHGNADSYSQVYSPSHPDGQSDSHSHYQHQHHADGGADSRSHVAPHSHSHSRIHQDHIDGGPESCSPPHSHSDSHHQSGSHSHDHHPHHLKGQEQHAQAHIHSHSDGSHEKCPDHGRQHSNQHHHHDHHHHSFTDNQDDLLKSFSGESHEINPVECLHVKEDFHNQDHTTKTGHDGHHHHHIDHNMEGIFLHVLADTLGSVGVVVATLLIKYKGWVIADPACSIFISVLIVSSVVPLLINSAEILLQRVPRALEQDLKAALTDVTKISGVRGIQNLHFWSLTNADVVGTLHLQLSDESNKAFAKDRVSHLLNDAGIKDLTLQVECVKNN